MKSFIAGLRTLTLPFGTKTGKRIVLDGINGVIQIYDAAGVLKLQLSPDNQDGESAFDVFDNAGHRVDKVSQSGFRNYDTAGTVRVFINNGQVSVADASANARIILTSTFLMVQDSTGIEVFSVDTTSGDAKVAQKSLPRGKMGTPFDNGTANDSARAAGVNTDMAVTFTADSTRLYIVHAKLQCNFGTAGVVYALDLVEGGTVGGADGTVIDRFARWSVAETPAGSLTGHVHAAVLYQPTSGSKTVRVGNDGGSGGTITAIGSSVIRRQMWVDDIGAR